MAHEPASPAPAAFQPWPTDCPIPSNAEWAALAPVHLLFLRLAWLTNTKTDEELRVVIADLGDDAVGDLADGLIAANQFFDALQMVALTAMERLLAAGGVDPEADTDEEA